MTSTEPDLNKDTSQMLMMITLMTDTDLLNVSNPPLTNITLLDGGHGYLGTGAF